MELNTFFRILRIKWLFRDQPDSRSDLERFFYQKSEWQPPKACVEVERFISKIQDNFNKWKTPRWIEDNLSKEERTLLKEIKNDENIVYMWEDKGPSFVKMTREQYITAGEKELEKDCYQIVPNDPSEKGKAENDKLVQQMLRVVKFQIKWQHFCRMVTKT